MTLHFEQTPALCVYIEKNTLYSHGDRGEHRKIERVDE